MAYGDVTLISSGLLDMSAGAYKFYITDSYIYAVDKTRHLVIHEYNDTGAVAISSTTIGLVNNKLVYDILTDSNEEFIYIAGTVTDGAQYPGVVAIDIRDKSAPIEAGMAMYTPTVNGGIHRLHITNNTLFCLSGTPDCIGTIDITDPYTIALIYGLPYGTIVTAGFIYALDDIGFYITEAELCSVTMDDLLLVNTVPAISNGNSNIFNQVETTTIFSTDATTGHFYDVTDPNNMIDLASFTHGIDSYLSFYDGKFVILFDNTNMLIYIYDSSDVSNVVELTSFTADVEMQYKKGNKILLADTVSLQYYVYEIEDASISAPMFGSTEVSNFMVGSTQIDKVMVGSELVWNNGVNT